VSGAHSSSEDRLRRRFRIASFIVILGLLVLTVIADTFGRLFIDPTFHSSDVTVVTLIGAVLGYASIEAISLLQPKKDDE
jgi:O-antigen/teichoic acid export membrane protein